MTTLDYTKMSSAEQELAAELAKKLLRTVRASKQHCDANSSVREKLATAFMKPENVVATIVCGSRDPFWSGEVVLRKGERFVQVSQSKGIETLGREAALAQVKRQIAEIKGMQEDPFVKAIRKQGIDPQVVEAFHIDHESFGTRWVLFTQADILRLAKGFADYIGAVSGTLMNQIQIARTVIIGLAPQLAYEDALFLKPNNRMDDGGLSFCLLLNAAAFLWKNGVWFCEDAADIDMGEFIYEY